MNTGTSPNHRIVKNEGWVLKQRWVLTCNNTYGGHILGHQEHSLVTAVCQELYTSVFAQQLKAEEPHNADAQREQHPDQPTCKE